MDLEWSWRFAKIDIKSDESKSKLWRLRAVQLTDSIDFGNSDKSK